MTSSPDSANHANAVPPRRSRRRRLSTIAGLLLVLISLAAGIWSQWSYYRTLGQHTQGVIALAFSQDGKTLYSGCGVQKNAATAGKVWEVATGRELRTFAGGEGVILSSNGQIVATIDLKNNKTEVWELDTGTKRVSLPDVTTDLWRIAFSPDGKLLAIAVRNVKQDDIFPVDTESGVINLWDCSSGKKIRCLGQGEMLVSGLSFSPDGKTLATCSSDGSVQLWDIASGDARAAIQTKQAGGSVNYVTFSPDGKYLVGLLGWRVIVWEVQTRKRLEVLTFGGYGPPVCLTFSPDGRFLAAGGGYMQWCDLLRGCEVVLWEAGTWQVHSVVKGRIVPGGDIVWRLAFSPDCSRLAFGSYKGYVGLIDMDR